MNFSKILKFIKEDYLIIIWGIVFFGALIFGGYSMYRNATLGNSNDDWEPVCVHGQLVYRANFFAKGMAVNALGDDSLKVKCEIKEQVTVLTTTEEKLKKENELLKKDRDSLLKSMEYIESTKRDDHHVYAGNCLYRRNNK